jgi:hypothetical protein
MPKEKRIVIIDNCVDKYTYSVGVYGEPLLIGKESTLTQEIKTRGKGLNPIDVKQNRENLDVIE